MRNGQNKRMRGRNRKSQNPMTRVFESNGPDVKIRGTPSHIAEKYLQLARDAQTSGDPVAAENYFQHAEHYFRLIAAAQEQFRQSNPQFYRGDENRDIFNGLTIAHSLFARGQYVPAENVAEITEGQVRLDLTKAAAEQLPEYSEPPPSEQILPE